MAANVETMFYTREKPWHGLGTMVAEAPTSAEALELAGLDWPVYEYIDALFPAEDGAAAAQRESAANERYRITWAPVSTARLDTKLLKEEEPEIYREYLKTTSTRRFTVSSA